MFDLQLANTYSPTKNYDVDSWWTSPKLDGVRGLYIAGQGLMSRSQKEKYAGLEHIEGVCQQIAAAGYQVIDGELYIPKEKFDVISGIVRKKKKYDVTLKQKVQLHVFALYSESKQWTNTEEMIQAIAQIIPSNQNAVVAIPYIQIPNNPVAIQAQNQLNKDSGASDEGTVLRHPNVAYNLGRSNHLLKVKNFSRSEFTIKDFAKGTGKYKSSLGKLVVEGTVNGVAVSAKVGTGFTDAERQEIWDNQSKYLDRKAEIVYMGVTKSGSLRLPVFSKVSPYLFGFPSREVNPVIKTSNGQINLKLGQTDQVDIAYDPNNPPSRISITCDGKILLDDIAGNSSKGLNSIKVSVSQAGKSFSQWAYEQEKSYYENPNPFHEWNHQNSADLNSDTLSLVCETYQYDGSYNGLTIKYWSRKWKANGQVICFVEERYGNNPYFADGIGSTDFDYCNSSIRFDYF